ncbi:Uncharacterised protein [Mycobacterium tuberculosis]|nr:Uncharacterised protein [Mycobacterium tuberculosis]
MHSRRSAGVRLRHPAGSENSEFSKKPSPRVNSVACGEIAVIVEILWWNSSLSIDAAVSPPPMTATFSATIRSWLFARSQNCAIDNTRGSPGRMHRSGWPGPVIISVSALRVES